MTLTLSIWDLFATCCHVGQPVLPLGNLCDAVCSPVCLYQTHTAAWPLLWGPAAALWGCRNPLCSQNPQSYLDFLQIPMDLVRCGAHGSFLQDPPSSLLPTLPFLLSSQTQSREMFAGLGINPSFLKPLNLLTAPQTFSLLLMA